MKKSLFFILGAAFCISLAAQRTSPFIPQSKGFSEKIGETHYITVTNASARNTISWSPDGSKCAAVWTIGGVPSGSPLSGERGTAINYFDQSTQKWGSAPSTEPPLERIENNPIGSPGWGTHVYTEEGECVVSHSSAAGGMYVNYREKRHEGEWQQYILKGPVLSNGSTIILWPTMVAVGNTIHMVCVTSNDYGVTLEVDGEQIPRCPIYFRSTDGGKTWEDYKTFDFSVMPLEDQVSLSADNYVLTTRGNHIVLAYAGGKVAYLESKDGGNTWTRTLVYDCSWSWTSTDLVGPMMYATTVAAAIGDDNVVHIAFSAQMRIRKHWIFYPRPYYYYLCGLFTWKEGQPLMHEDDMGVIYNAATDEIEGYTYNQLPNFIDAPSVLGFDKFYWRLSHFPDLNNNYGNPGYISHPRLIATGGKVYLMYSSIIEKLPSPISGEFYRGVFLTVSHDNGDTYNQKDNTSWLSYHEDYFFYDWSNYGGPAENGIDHIGYIEVIKTSENGYPTMSMNTKNDRLIFTWLNDYFPFPTTINDTPWMSESFGVFSVNICTSEAGVYNNTNEVWQGLWNKIAENERIENFKIYPNPANDKAVIEVNINHPYTLTVTNIMGQVLHTEKGQQNKIELNVAHYPAGVYIVNVKTASAAVSQKLIVR
ncbi:MAG: T9SS type A sorting domain-containing protein [Bacteroidetes bacterium]|nr:T9SS type A sorting domain-containing protein [Bacteroidota bacterium]MCL2302010.1 T9SS type A sorting domain-containing protein [Lentimicrobiaceae bacterium]